MVDVIGRGKGRDLKRKIDNLKEGGFSGGQIGIIEKHISKGYDASLLLNPKFSVKQLEALAFGVRCRRNVTNIADPDYSDTLMHVMIRCIGQNVNYSPLLRKSLCDAQLKSLTNALIRGIDVSSFCNGDFSSEHIDLLAWTSARDMPISHLCDPRLSAEELEEAVYQQFLAECVKLGIPDHYGYGAAYVSPKYRIFFDGGGEVNDLLIHTLEEIIEEKHSWTARMGEDWCHSLLYYAERYMAVRDGKESNDE